MEDFSWIDLKNFLQMFTIHHDIPVAYQCCSTTLRIVLKYRHLSFSSDDLVEHLNTALAVLLAEVIQSHRTKELQVSGTDFHLAGNEKKFFFSGYIKFN